ncbi:unnamed protein product [Brugia timori]|uniref:Uncharacterized protein n=1 Tax=Brugia timori TaxID=42155 RepID=A0A3P7TWN1_9BILA|nr:unnamed protein product [Brugia timori]
MQITPYLSITSNCDVYANFFAVCIQSICKFEHTESRIDAIKLYQVVHFLTLSLPFF